MKKVVFATLALLLFFMSMSFKWTATGDSENYLGFMGAGFLFYILFIVLWAVRANRGGDGKINFDWFISAFLSVIVGFIGAYGIVMTIMTKMLKPEDLAEKLGTSTLVWVFFAAWYIVSYIVGVMMYRLEARYRRGFGITPHEFFYGKPW